MSSTTGESEEDVRENVPQQDHAPPPVTHTPDLPGLLGIESQLAVDDGKDDTTPDDILPDLAESDSLDLAQDQDGRPIDLQPRESSPGVEETSSLPDDNRSVQDSILSSPRSVARSILSSDSRLPSTPPRTPFERRFQSRLSASPLASPRASSLGFLDAHSRQPSIGSSSFHDDPVPTSAPWDVIRWSKLRKLTGQLFSEVGKRSFGRPTCFAISNTIIVGTSKGIVLVFDYQQTAKVIVGSGTKAVECGSVTSLAVSEDSTSIVVGHAEGHIFTWELANPSRPFLHIPPPSSNVSHGKGLDGHRSGASVIHVGFLGFRHTALVSADDSGMAFSHLATRGMGSIGRAIRTTRVLGRYPTSNLPPQQQRKPSSVLAFSPLPFGNVEQASNQLGLLALMTPYLLVIVSTTPIAQTQHKAARPKEVAAHGAMTAALAWFPAIKLKNKDATTSITKLVYCWSNVLTILEVTEMEPSRSGERDKQLELSFKARSRWRSQESIVAVQWLSRSVMAVLTLSQQLIILEDISMNPTDSLDLVQRQIYHRDLFSQQLHSLVEELDEEDSSMHGVVADAFYMSFRAYKGRLFLLGANDVSIGSLSNWADRLLSMLEAGDFIGAIRLATSYYLGGGEKVTIGLPEDDKPRHAMVREKLIEMMSASLQYAFGEGQETGSGRQDASQLTSLAVACVAACLVMGDTAFLFDEIFSWYDEYEQATIFVDTLEPYIFNGQIKSIPPAALKALIERYMTTHAPASLEEIICCLDTSTMDIDQITSLCKNYNLYDAFVYVWTTVLGDYVGPIEQLLSFSRAPLQSLGPLDDVDSVRVNAMKIFPYLSFTLTSRIYPTGSEMDEEESRKAKEQIYETLFSGTSSSPSGKSLGATSNQSFYVLRELLLLDASSSMSLFNEALEDSFLNMPDDFDGGLNRRASLNGVIPTQTFTRQFIITVLLQVMSMAALGPADTIFIDMFIARSLPKYPQDLVLPGSTLDDILVRLCHFPELDTGEDCQLSVEYLLSVHHPPDLQSFVPLFKEARFFRVLRSVYRTEGQWCELVQAYFLDDQDQDEVFDVIRSCLGKDSELSPRQLQAVRATVQDFARDMANLDVGRTARLVAEVMPEAHALFLSSLEDDSHLQYQYLNSLFKRQDGLPALSASSPLMGRYIQLMCQYEPLHVADYMNSLKSMDLQPDDVLPSMEAGGIIDGAVILLTRQGRVKDAMNRLTKHLRSLEIALSGLVHNLEGSPDGSSTSEATRDLLESIKKYSGVGIWLCQFQSKAARRAPPVTKLSRKSKTSLSRPLSFEENLWLQLINATVGTAKTLSRPQVANQNQMAASEDEDDLVTKGLRVTVQNVFTALLQATTTSREQSASQDEISFLHILRAFLTQAAASSPSLAELRGVLASILSAYAYEKSLLALSNSMLDKDLYVHVDEIAKLRQRGWRPRGQICEVCRRRVWGPGAGSQVWEAWVEQGRRSRTMLQQSRELVSVADEQQSRASKGKGKAIAPPIPTPAAGGDDPQPSASDVIDGERRPNGTGTVMANQALVFACRHLFHRGCFDQIHGGVERVCPICERKPLELG